MCAPVGIHCNSAKQLSHSFAVRLASKPLLQGSALGARKCPGDRKCFNTSSIHAETRWLHVAVSTANTFLDISSSHDCTIAVLCRVE